MRIGAPDIDLEGIDADKIALLEGVPSEKRRAVLRCMGAGVLTFKRGSSLKEVLVKPQSTFYLLTGVVRIMRIDVRGERTILCDCDSNTPLFSSDFPSFFGSDDIQIEALEQCKVLDFSISREVEGCACCVKYVSTVRENMSKGLFAANEQLLIRLDIVSRRTIRSKLEAFLATQARLHGSTSFEVNMSRQDLADYLCVERSALSREIGKMRDEGLIECNKGRFVLSNAMNPLF